jgi:uncharacterized protein (DUF433 family)
MNGREYPPVPLGEGAYSVATICRILQPTMTSRKVHYWLDTALIGKPLRSGGPGHPTMLTFQQLLRIATVQRLRDEFKVPLPRVRAAFKWILDHLFETNWRELTFTRAVGGGIVVSAGHETMAIPSAQGVLDSVLPDLNSYVLATRHAWELRILRIPKHDRLVSDARVLAGAPVVAGTRLETALIASFAEEGVAKLSTVRRVKQTFPSLDEIAIREAFKFEGIQVLAA